MIWRALFGRRPDGLPLEVKTLLLVEAREIDLIEPFARSLQSKFGDVGVAVLGSASYAAHPSIQLDGAGAAQRLENMVLDRLIAVGDRCATLLPAGVKSYVVNATRAPSRAVGGVFVADPALTTSLANASASGDPLADASALPAMTPDQSACERFKEQREGKRWVGYFAATGNNEEERAYLIFNRLIRHKMGLMVLAPRDPARCEPVYRESIKYRLQTIRHNRLSTSFVPIKTRVYYVEDEAPRNAMYACCDWVVVGGTLDDNAYVMQDIVSPIQAGRPVVIGPAGDRTPLTRAALRAGVVYSAHDMDALFDHLREIIDAPAAAAERARRARAWLEAQPGAIARIVGAID